MVATIESYLTEDKLAAVLQQLTGDSWVGRQIALPGSRGRCDMAFRRKDHRELSASMLS